MTDDGVGCRSALLTVASTLVIAGAMFALGLRLTVDEGCTGACSSLGLALYAAGAPVSGLFAALAGGLPVAWPVDVIAWVAAGIGSARVVERRRRPAWQAPLGLLTLALVWGAVVSLLVERV